MKHRKNNNVESKTKSKLSSRNSNKLLLLSLPGVAWFVVFSYLPMAGLVLAFKNYRYADGIFGSEWVGFKNFEFFFRSNDAERILSNTIGYNLVFLFFNLFVAVTIALLLGSVGRKTVKVGQSCMLLPYFVSWVIVGYIGMAMFDYEDGLLNNILIALERQPIAWYETPGPWRIIVVLFNCWKTVGTTTLMFYGTLLGIDESLFEAAAVDGCTGIKKIFMITLPLLKPAIITMIILNIGSVMKADFGLFYYLPDDRGLLYSVTDVVDTYVYRALRVSGDISTSSAVGFFQSIVGFVMVVATNWIVKKLEPGSEMF